MSHELKTLNNQIKSEILPSPGVQESHSATGTPPPPSGNVSTSQSKSTKSKRMACVECRQQKSKCDAHEKHPNPCTRCAKKGLQCDLKSDYKRTYKRARIAQIEKEFTELKKTLSASQAELVLKPHVYPGHQFSQSPPVLNRDSPVPQIRHQYTDQQANYQYLRNGPGVTGVNHPAPAPPPIPQPVQLTSYTPFNQQRLQPVPLQNNQNHNHESFPVVASPYEKYSRHSSETNNSIPNTPSIARPPDGSAPFNFQYSNIEGPQSEPKVVIPDYALACEDKHLDAVALPAATIRELFVEYVENYHPILPVVDVMKGPERIYKLCPALFWVIMFVSLRRFHEDAEKTLLIQLSPLVKGVLAEIMISPITRYNPTEEDEPILNGLSAYAVQAFLLYSFWPPITSSLSADSSYSTVGNAFYQAIRIGLHSPGPLFSADISHKTPQQLAMAQENAKTWIVCNCVSQAIATSFGFPAFVQFDSSIWTLFRPGSILQIPKSIQFMMEIAYFEDQVARTLNSNPMDTYGLVAATERLPLLKLLTRRLDELEVRMAHELPNDDGFRKFQLLSSRVHLLTYHFMDATLVAEFELQRGLVQLYNAAIALISHTQLFQTRNRKFVKHLPGVYILNIWQAACIIGKLTHSSLKRVLDTGSGKQMYEAAISLAAKSSILKHDVAHRASGIMKNMWQLFRTLDDKKMSTLTINIRTRMSASVFFDCMYLLRDQVGMIKLNNRTDSKTAENHEGNDDDAASYDEEDYGFNNNEEAIVSDNEDNPMGPQSQKSTPGSSTSSGRKRRSLSNTVNAESKARKIIRTIPLDPQPIAVGGSGKRSTIFKVVNASNDSSPSVRADKETPPSGNTSQKYLQSPEATKYSLHPHNRSTHNQQRTMALPEYQSSRINGIPGPNGQGTADAMGSGAQVMPSVFNDSPHASLENIDFDLNGDVLWNDVESVMNDFGFNI